MSTFNVFRASLCADCAHVKRIESQKGSTFLLCRRSATDPRYPKYPPQPVFACRGHEREPPSAKHSSESV